MGNMWLKLRIWIKTSVISIVALYALLFIYNNSGQPVTFWYWFHYKYDTDLLILIGMVYAAGILTVLFVRAAFSTRRQVRELRERQKAKALNDMVNKANMLNTQTSPTTPNSTPTNIK